MENFNNIHKASDFVIGNSYIENNYYIYVCTAKLDTFTADYGTDYQHIEFSVRTKTGRFLGTEIYKYSTN